MTLRGRLQRLERAVADAPPPAPPDPRLNLSFEELRRLPPQELQQLYRTLINQPAPPRRPEDEAEFQRLCRLPPEELHRLYWEKIEKPLMEAMGKL
ncbi:MAG TPA: hypothetical protein VMS17_30700 [Gemmataceae bacterium]|nr:hypothetical protein [Gemmataceae bacterium]